MSRNYNQLNQDDTLYSCSIYAFLNCIKFDYGIELTLEEILEVNQEMKYKKYLFPKGAKADIIFPVLVKWFNKETGLNITIQYGTIRTLDDKKAWILGFKRSSRTYTNLITDKELSKEDIDIIIDTKKYYGHFHCWKKGIILESLGGLYYKAGKNLLIYAYKNRVYYKNVRSFIPKDDRTIIAREMLIELAKEKGKNKYISLKELKTFDFLKGNYS